MFRRLQKAAIHATLLTLTIVVAEPQGRRRNSRHISWSARSWRASNRSSRCSSPSILSCRCYTVALSFSSRYLVAWFNSSFGRIGRG